MTRVSMSRLKQVHYRFEMLYEEKASMLNWFPAPPKWFIPPPTVAMHFFCAPGRAEVYHAYHGSILMMAPGIDLTVRQVCGRAF